MKPHRRPNTSAASSRDGALTAASIDSALLAKLLLRFIDCIETCQG